MNQKHFWTVVALFTTVVGTPSVGHSQMTKETPETSGDSPNVASSDVVKVGEYQSPTDKPTSDTTVLTKIHTHEVAGVQAATLYVRDIPILTFVGQQPVTDKETKVGELSGVTNTQLRGPVTNSVTKLATVGTSVGGINQLTLTKDDPIHRASVVATKINQLLDDKIDAQKITVSWKALRESTTANETQQLSPRGRYIIKVDGEELVEINGDTRLADTTNDPANDALQATNRLRRLIGQASPLNKIANLPEPPRSLPMPSIPVPKLPSALPIKQISATFKGIASWYGYDGSGPRTATGERFNPEGLTAAHRSLPFGTRVRVTNVRNGRSVVVRINDRGPFIRGRIIDLSAGAARILGMMGSGLAPVRIEVLGR
jgi:rare lipoprotein A